MMKRLLFVGGAALALAGCVSMPTGPSVNVLPGSGKNFDQFRADDYDCRQYAGSQTGTSAEAAQENSTVKSAALGTAVGAAAGALIGGRGGAASGAAGGLIVGTAAGAGAGNASGYSLQRRYDNAYIQCMYAKGHRVPVAGRFETTRPAPPAQSYAPPPPPPPGTPPPPPPGVR